MDQPRETSENQCNRLYPDQYQYGKPLSSGDSTINKPALIPPLLPGPHVFVNGNSHHMADGRNNWHNPDQVRYMYRHGIHSQSARDLDNQKQAANRLGGFENFVNNVNFSPEEANWLRQQNFNAMNPLSSHMKSAVLHRPRHNFESSQEGSHHQGHMEYEGRSQIISPVQLDSRNKSYSEQTESRSYLQNESKTYGQSKSSSFGQTESRSYNCPVTQSESRSHSISFEKNKYGSDIKPEGQNYDHCSERADKSKGKNDEYCPGHEVSRSKYFDPIHEFENAKAGTSNGSNEHFLNKGDSHDCTGENKTKASPQEETGKSPTEIQGKKAKAKFHMKISLKDNKVSLSEELMKSNETDEYEFTDDNQSSNADSKDTEVQQKKRERKQKQTRRITGSGDATSSGGVVKRGRRPSKMQGVVDEKLFECTICYKQVKSNLSLKLHLQTHAGIKPHKCSECGKCFTQISSLKTHMRKHTGETPYKCETCEKAFSVRLYLQAHARVHTGDRPFECIRCGNKFTQASSLRTHEKKNCRSGI